MLLYSCTMLLYTSLLLQALGLATAQAACYGVFCTETLASEEECRTPGTLGPCSTLEFFDKDGVSLTMIQLTRDDASDRFEEVKLGRGVKNVASVRQIGPGCHRVFKGRRFKGEELTLEGSNMHSLAEKGYGATVIKSVKYDIDCKFPPAPNRAGVGWQIPVLAISLAGNIALGVVVFLVYRKGRRGEPVSTARDKSGSKLSLTSLALNLA